MKYRRCVECNMWAETRKFHGDQCRSCFAIQNEENPPEYGGDRLPNDPTEDEIAATCEAIRRQWGGMALSLRDRRKAVKALARATR